jgi:predicted NBD/HSP70 family sugar kinase
MHALKDRIGSRKSKDIFDRIRRQRVVSKTDLIEQSGMKVSTLTRSLEELESLGLICDAGRGESTGGRRPVLYQIRPDRLYVLGLDISRAASQLLLCDLHMNKCDSESWSMSADMTPNALIRNIAEAIQRMMDKHGLAKTDILGLGIGAVGPLDRLNGVILNPLHFPAEGWFNVPIKGTLEAELDIPVVLDNGANAGIWAEYWADPSRQYEHLLYIRAGVGLRSAMISNGQLVYGAVDMEGSIGQMIIQSDGIGHRDRPNSYGCLESYVSIHAIEQQLISRLKQGRQSLAREWVDDVEQIAFPHLLRAVELGDPLTVEIFTQAATCFGIGMANLLNILHPQKVILGGALISGNSLFFKVCTEVALSHTYYYPAYRVDFGIEQEGEETLATGAAMMVINGLTD